MGLIGSWGQMFDASGNKAGNEILLSDSNFQPAITALSNGGYAVSSTSGPVEILLLDKDGNQINDLIEVAGTDAVNERSKIAALTDGGFVLVWERGGGQRFDAAGNLVATDPIVVRDRPNVTGMADGGFYIVHIDNVNANEDLYGQRFDANGNAGTPINMSDISVDSSVQNPQIQLLANGDLIVTWTDRIFSINALDNNDIFGQLINPDGTKKGDLFLVNTTVDGDEEFSSITSLADGGFAVAWRSDGMFNGEYQELIVVQ